ncbi:hypothetical protein T492DRAFT_1110001 [Pavlovales sp. CCMP2436]|nr:hypothetical protein T492DRAFT_1110001 [Pavlovales sp. CCMP2436]
MTGAEHAVELVRQCWQNKPLSAEERTNLGVLASFASRAPALVLLCDELERSSCSLEFLYAQKDASIGLPATDVTCGAPPQRPLGHLFSGDAAVEYELRSPLAPRNFRLRLTAEEELRCFGRSTGGDWRGASCPSP